MLMADGCKRLWPGGGGSCYCTLPFSEYQAPGIGAALRRDVMWDLSSC